ncbi:MAG: hypothetical protein JWP69_2211 [Flaviaesturariibacter sp.]|nr:hypothetical protein [Flaviaesturariibacter sp.]
MYRLLSLLLLFSVTAGAQKIEAFYDYQFKPTDKGARYYVVTQKEGDAWHRQAWYLPERTLAIDAWYKDSAAKIPHGKETWYHTTGYPETEGNYVDGKKEGPWLRFSDSGLLKDSLNYAAGYYNGQQLKWNGEGYLTDSAVFDGRGNGTWVHWTDEGIVYSAGRYVRDTAKIGRWKYYHSNGNVLATEDYTGDGKPVCHCYTAEGVELDTLLCYEKEANFTGGLNAWRKYLERSLNAQVPGDNGAKNGYYTVLVKFVVDKEGNISNISALTKHGYGMEEEVIRS